MNPLRRPFQIIRADLRAYLLINALIYAMFFLGMALALIFPDLHAARSSSFVDGDQGALVETVIGTPWIFGTTIFVVNVFATALPLIVLPSLVIPFAGLAVFAIKTIDIGIMLAPVDQTTALILIPHSLTVLIEFQAYALVMFGAYLLGRSWLRPTTVGATTRRQAYARGLSRLGWLWLPALALFVIGAVYEAFEIYFLVPLVLGV
ncbi:stage II sporulation protein M [Nocardiopsis sp. CT-R113]|uniref:Stage II sporulation protein M n=1 Tax=Nocardiopsis codii TaxID=3065942 RepID=A0ABU7K709_9ACTN|nr:stage II sporulation protein M [Nocardiopsis sp. CT-R113]MEE2037649.1 stage II sporulation protein M [Nocardiopsis sp. CT-R113]